MLDAYIIESIRREEQTRDERGRIWLELPLDSNAPVPERHRSPSPSPSIDSDGHVVIIPLRDAPEDEAA